MLRERLKDMDLRITELAEYLKISRPTMYKFIDYYDNTEFDLINKKVLKLFNYISEHELVGKTAVINYILNNLVDLKDMGGDSEIAPIKMLRNYIAHNPESKKTQFLSLCASKDTFDDIMPYLVEIQPLLKKRKLTDEEKTLLEPYITFKKIILDKGE